MRNKTYARLTPELARVVSRVELLFHLGIFKSYEATGFQACRSIKASLRAFAAHHTMGISGFQLAKAKECRVGVDFLQA
jgi:hypothetical protein